MDEKKKKSRRVPLSILQREIERMQGEMRQIESRLAIIQGCIVKELADEDIS